MITTKARGSEAFNTVANSVFEHAGVRARLGRLKAWSRSGEHAPKGLGHAWQGDKAEADNELVVLGAPLGTKAFVESFAAERLQKEQTLLDELPK